MQRRHITQKKTTKLFTKNVGNIFVKIIITHACVSVVVESEYIRADECVNSAATL